MTNAQHTPGPWKFAQAGQSTMLMTEANNPLGFFYNERNAGEETKANARLIAAAPELLEMLQTVQIWADTTKHPLNVMDKRMFDNVRAAIAKATNHPAGE